MTDLELNSGAGISLVLHDMILPLYNHAYGTSIKFINIVTGFGFSGYMQITIAPEDQEKTSFTYPF